MLDWEKKLAVIDEKQESFSTCFGCGQENPVGLKLQFTQAGDEAYSEFTLNENYEGWYGFVHGGIICTILDEAMAYTYFPMTKGVTAKAEFRFRQPAPIGEPMIVRAKLTKRTRKLLTASAALYLQDGTVLAESTAQAYVINTV
jgi:acyl-coenzyme A thioesterase PaaI-like protein